MRQVSKFSEAHPFYFKKLKIFAVNTSRTSIAYVYLPIFVYN